MNLRKYCKKLAMASVTRRGTSTLITIFSELEEPRKPGMCEHPLINIVMIALLAVLCGAEGWEDFTDFGETREAWLGEFLDLSAGIPSADTFRRVFERIKPEAFSTCLRRIVENLAEHARAQGKSTQIAIDGKTLRHAFRKAGGLAALHLVHAWCVQSKLLLAQKATEAKSNEITAIPALLDILELDGVTVTSDAMGCQRDISQKIVDAKGDYVIALKDNQPRLAADVEEAFEALATVPKLPAKVSQTSESNKGHGRVEGRTVTAMPVPPVLQEQHHWPGLKSLVRVQSIRVVGEQRSEEFRYYISSRKAQADIIRAHWGVENQLHWILDVALHEDDNKIASRNGAENFALLRRTALTLLSRYKGSKRGIRAKQKIACWSQQALLDILFGGLADPQQEP